MGLCGSTEDTKNASRGGDTGAAGTIQLHIQPRSHPNLTIRIGADETVATLRQQIADRFGCEHCSSKVEIKLGDNTVPIATDDMALSAAGFTDAAKVQVQPEGDLSWEQLQASIMAAGMADVHMAAQIGNMKVMCEVANYAPLRLNEPNEADGRCTPLHKAAFHSKVGVVRLLLDSAVVVDPKDMRNATPLHLAVRRESAEVVELLVLARADVHAKDDFGETPLQRAKMCNHADHLYTLLTKPAWFKPQGSPRNSGLN